MATGTADALSLLRDDHAAVKKLFQQFKRRHKSMSDDEKQDLVQKICHELTVHATVEEEIFYPRVRQQVKDAEELMDEAEVEHASAKQLIAELENGSPDEGIYDAQVTVLGEYVNHHVEEEEGSLFPKVKRAKMDLAGLGSELAERKRRLQ